MKLALLFSLIVLNWTVPLTALLLDRRRLTPEQRARSWNVATFGCAIYWFGYLAALPWVWVTRQRWSAWIRRGPAHALAQSTWLLVKGAAAAALLFAIYAALGTGISALLGVDLDEPDEVQVEGGKRPPPARRP